MGLVVCTFRVVTRCPRRRRGGGGGDSTFTTRNVQNDKAHLEGS